MRENYAIRYFKPNLCDVSLSQANRFRQRTFSCSAIGVQGSVSAVKTRSPARVPDLVIVIVVLTALVIAVRDSRIRIFRVVILDNGCLIASSESPSQDNLLQSPNTERKRASERASERARKEGRAAACSPASRELLSLLLLLIM